MKSTILQQPGKFAIAERPNPAAEADQVAAAFEEYERNPSRILRIVIDAGGEERGDAPRVRRANSRAACANPAAQGPQPCAESARFTGLSMVNRPLTILGL